MILTLTLNPCLDRVIELDSLEPGMEIQASAVREAAAGKGINVSRMVRSLEGETLAIWACGGFTGRKLKHLLAEEGMPNIAIPISGELRTNYTLAERRGRRSTRVFEPGPEVTPAEADVIEATVVRLAAQADVLVLAGSVPCSLLDGLYARVISKTRAKGVKTIVDARNHALRLAIRQAPYLVRLNAAEAAEITEQQVNDPETALRAASKLRELGAEFVVVSLGVHGAVLTGQPGSWHAPAPRVETASPVGSGDSMAAAIALGIARHWPPVEWLRWGVAAGAANATTWLPGICTRETVERLHSQVAATELQFSD